MIEQLGEVVESTERTRHQREIYYTFVCPRVRARRGLRQCLTHARGITTIKLLRLRQSIQSCWVVITLTGVVRQIVNPRNHVSPAFIKSKEDTRPGSEWRWRCYWVEIDGKDMIAKEENDWQIVKRKVADRYSPVKLQFYDLARIILHFGCN